MICQTCSYANRSDANYCGMCGARLTKICQACGFANPRDYRFCIHCGMQFGGETSLPAAAMQVASPAASPIAGDTAVSSALPGPKIGMVPPSPETTQLEGERRVATIIMADVHSSTNLMERVGTETWVELMNRIFQLMEAEIYRFDGRVDQFRGDGLVAFFGTTVAHEDDPERGVLAAMGMQRAVRTFAAELQHRENISLSLRVGVNTGEVIVASVGDHRTYSEDTAMGEAIALAARMEQAAEPGTVLVSENTYNLVKSQFEWLPLGDIMVKGISNPVSVYRPLASRMASELPDLELIPPLIGREREVELLLSAAEDLRAGRGGIVMLTGDRGMGKSLILQETRRTLMRRKALRAEGQSAEEMTGSGDERDYASPLVLDDDDIREIRGRARSYDQSRPYAVWQDIIRNWLGIQTDEPIEKTQERLRQEAKKLWGPEELEYYPDLCRFLGLPLEPIYAQRVQHLDAESMRQRLFLAVRSWIEQLTLQSPLILTFSDMHWADTTSLDLLKYCLPLCDYLDLLWLFIFRPDRLSSIWEFSHYLETEYPHRLITVDLPPLTAEQSKTLIEQMIGKDVLSEETLALIIQKAEGNPFFTGELVRSLIADGSLVREVTQVGDEPPVEQWRATQAITTLSLPDSLQGLLMARIDRLTSADQDILQRAAVIGSIFWSKVLEAISPDCPDLRSQLTALQRAQLITERGRGPDLGVEYTFQSKLIRDAAYDSLLSSQRAAYHLRIAEYLEAQYERNPAAQNQSFYYGELAHHYQHARQPEKELVYTLKNAERAKEIYANAEASQHYSQALRLLERLSETTKDETTRYELKSQCFEVLINRRKVYHLMGEYANMRADALALLPLARELPDQPMLLIDALLQQPGVSDYQCRKEIEDGIPMAEEALELAQQIEDQHREVESLIALANQRLALSDPAWRQLAERALTLSRGLGNHDLEARILIGMGGIFAFSDEPDQSMEYLEAAAALAMSEGLEDKLIQMSLLNLLGLEYERNGDYYRLLTDYQMERLRASREIGHRPMQSQALQACGRIMGIYLGDYNAGLNALEECRRILHENPDEVYPLFHIVQIQVAQADHTGAANTLREVYEIGEPVQDRAKASLKLVELILRNAEGARAATKGDNAKVSVVLHEALKLAEDVIQLALNSPLVSRQYEMGAQCKAATAYLGLAQISKDTSAAEITFLQGALNAAESAYDIFQRFGFTQIVEVTSEEVLFRYSQALAANGQQELGVRFLRRAYDEMMRKYAFIPIDSHYRRTYLEQIPLHREIRAAYASRVGSILTDALQPWYQAELTTG